MSLFDVLKLVVSNLDRLKIPFDLTYLRKWASELGVGDLLERALEETRALEHLQ